MKTKLISLLDSKIMLLSEISNLISSDEANNTDHTNELNKNYIEVNAQIKLLRYILNGQ